MCSWRVDISCSAFIGSDIFNIVKMFFNSIQICLYWCLYLFFKWPLQFWQVNIFVKFPRFSIWPPSNIRKFGVFRYFIALRLICIYTTVVEIRCYILSFPPGKMSIYWDFPPEKWVYTEFSPRKTKNVLTHTYFPPSPVLIGFILCTLLFMYMVEDIIVKCGRKRV